MVSRNQPEVDPSSRACSTGDFWDRLVRQPSSLWMEEYREAPPLLTSGRAAQRPAVGEGGPWPWQVASTAQSLPSPKELCQKKRKGPKQKGLGNVRALSVFYHLEEKVTRGSWALPQPSSQGNRMVGDPPGGLLSPTRTPKPYGRPFRLGGGTSAQLLHPEPNPSLREPVMFPEESPMALYTTAAHQRSPRGRVGCWPGRGRSELRSEE
ncbi:protein INCA1 isoform X2 [Python bivittatus]|uniref:Protein INCA1 isoform X2 n=1 Tax=Python bivittatus TaxID=176946 RepID=A0A9F5J7G0_PYTBI|nr:protein INCA1 isoform X2 [Python bivittatus]